MIYLPKGSPYLNAMEKCWYPGKRVLLVSKTFQDMHRAVSLYSGDHKFVQNNAAFLLANLSMSRVNLAVL